MNSQSCFSVPPFWLCGVGGGQRPGLDSVEDTKAEFWNKLAPVTYASLEKFAFETTAHENCAEGGVVAPRRIYLPALRGFETQSMRVAQVWS